MENESQNENFNENQVKNNNKTIVFVLVGILVIAGVLVTLYFYNKNSLGDNTTDDMVDETKENTAFTELKQLSLKNNETQEITIGGKTLNLKLVDKDVYLNDQKIYSSEIDIDNTPNNVIVTNKMILITKPAGQFGNEYAFYDLDGKEIKYVGVKAQYNNLKIEDGELKVDAFVFNNQWMSGYKIGNVLTIEGTKECSGKKLKDYPNVIEEHKNDVLKADYYFCINGNELVLKYDKVLLTVGDLDLDTCVMEEDNNN